MRSAIPTADIAAWRQQHPLEAAWNRCFAPYLERRRWLRRYIRQRYMDCGRRGKGNKATRRATALYNRPDVLCWPDYLR